VVLDRLCPSILAASHAVLPTPIIGASAAWHRHGNSKADQGLLHQRPDGIGDAIPAGGGGGDRLIHPAGPVVDNLGQQAGGVEVDALVGDAVAVEVEHGDHRHAERSAGRGQAVELATPRSGESCLPTLTAAEGHGSFHVG
jgi:hypothetical protein